MFTLNAFSLDVICFLCYSSFSMVQALRDSDEYFSKKFLCRSVCQLHNEYKLTKCEILLPTKLMRLWLSEECALSICSVSRAEPLVVDHCSGTFDFGDLHYFFFFFFFFGDEVSWKKGRRFFNYCQWALQEKSWKRKKSRFHSNRLNRPIFCFLKMVLPQFYIVKECSHCLLPKNPISHRKRQNYPFFLLEAPAFEALICSRA